MIANTKIGFIGFGNMAKALAEGLIIKNVVKPNQIYACARNWDNLCKSTQANGMNACKTSQELVNESDIVVIAVKPNVIPSVIEPIKENLKDKIVISVAAGYTFDKYEELLLPGTSHLSTIPNTPVSIGEGIIVAEKCHSLTDEEYKLINEIFSKIALLEFVDSNQLSIAGTISGCGPAFASMFIEALSDAAVKHGLTREASYKLASKMILGTGKLQIETGEHPGAMKDAVCSPGGTTILGVTTLEKKGFRGAIVDAIDAIEGK
ncbi:pyrroline-5-carboxylate reductase [Paraclostridium bifermentans]|uniref:pyrroline-5-carboxylate reductase n=2 Tax=Clostridia TaxID=186801 RepID=UPI00038CAEE9|nr:pyrroline-5-carboxylate reductase [Paraclostridium bifermentans]MCU9809978.1 pyrroline-5-carboxylate reductase [Paraclostridium sp. AKS46]EQK38496.1 pyrroline-5-carboxylate reductase [[Clostridium] bifermentans ATCC 19299] [Paraclostridium bifermentans ATCC 19299]MCE9675302.1 pyrroline-5-carboxylate reductase [Paraclostridium bifermentans]MCR1875879.1 pyrroline-5-carboxylate reductase [Paraclostridium bifermentans]TQO56597.1 pyrroline-5-carboxylate reductase [Paraclostridium bifermentans]